jgi:hypothetical protein
VHWIQLRLSWSEPTHPPIPGTLLDIDRDGEFVVAFDDGVVRYWHHDPDRLASLVARNNGQVEKRSHSLLVTRSEQGFYPFCVAAPESEHRHPCQAARK